MQITRLWYMKVSCQTSWKPSYIKRTNMTDHTIQFHYGRFTNCSHRKKLVYNLHLFLLLNMSLPASPFKFLRQWYVSHIMMPPTNEFSWSKNKLMNINEIGYHLRFILFLYASQRMTFWKLSLGNKTLWDWATLLHEILCYEPVTDIWYYSTRAKM